MSRTGQPNLTRETKLSSANGDRENSVFPVQLTTSRIDNPTWLMPSLLKVMTIHTHTTLPGVDNAYVFSMCVVITFSRLGINRVWLPILLVLS